MAGAMLVIAAVLAVWLGVPANTPQRGHVAKDRPLRRRRQPWYRRFNTWRRQFLTQPLYWKIGSHVASLDQTHGLVVGGSGSGKSTLVVSLILQPTINLYMRLMRGGGAWKRRPVVIVSFDRSDPIEEATNVLEDRGICVERWRVREANGWNLLEGDIEMIAEALPCGWPSGDNTGFFQQLATDAISTALQEQDAEGKPREINDMIERMDNVMALDPETPDLARRTWVRRFRSLARVMGDSLGQDFDLVSALKPGAVIHISSNSYTNPALTPLVGAMAITQIKMAAEKVGGVYLVLEEARFLKKRSDLLDDLATSLRARGWRMAYLNQDPCAVGEALQVNFGVAVFMGLGPLAQKAREWCASVVKGFPGAFRAEELVLGATIDTLEGYVLLNGRCRDVSLAPYITRAAEHREARGKDHLEPAVSSVPLEFESDTEVIDTEAEADEPREEGAPEMPAVYRMEIPEHPRRPGANAAQLLNIWTRHRFPEGMNGCYESTFSVNNSGRPRCSFMGGDWTTYVLIRALEDARCKGLTGDALMGHLSDVQRQTAAGQLTVDHGCEFERCDRPDHLAWQSRSRNSELYHERRREAAVSAA